MKRTLCILIACLALLHHAKSQVYVNIKGTSAISPCINLPIEIEIINDESEPITNIEIKIKHSNEYNLIIGSQTNQTIQFVKNEDDYSIFHLTYLDACESERFIVQFKHSCISDRITEDFLVELNSSHGSVLSNLYQVTLYNVQVDLIGLNLYFDTLDQVFKKTYRVFNTGRVVLDSFTIEVTNQDNMDILNTNIGQLSGNGDILNISNPDFRHIGNFNDFFEPGEFFDIIQIIDIDACQSDIQIDHFISIQCGTSTCTFEEKTDLGLLSLVTEPILYILSDVDTFATPCEEGAINFKVFGSSRKTGFDNGSALYNIVLDLGWSVYRRPNRTDPRKDNCLEIFDASINGTPITLIKNGFSGYGLRFDQLQNDPDGPGGLQDLDNDGFYDDLLTGDFINISLKYKLDKTCLNFSCNQEVFETRYFRVNSRYRNYCDEEFEADRYLNHNLSWTRPYVGISNLDNIYTDLDRDTITINLNRSMIGFLNECDNDSSIITITLPNSVELESGSEILLNNEIVNYSFNSNIITIITDTSRFRIQIPIVLHCKKGSNSGGVNTACTFCYGSGLPKSRIKVNVDYFCNAGCYNKIPLYCYTSPAFAVACKGAGAGIVTEGKFVIDSLYLTRKTVGHKDSSQTARVDPTIDSLNLTDLMTFDSFDLTIPFDIRCDANYKNILFKLIQFPIYIGNNTIGRDTLQTFTYYADTIKFYDKETDRWSICTNVLGPQYYNQRRDAFYRHYIREINISDLLNTCMIGRFTTPDSLVIIVSGVVNNVTTRNFQRSNIRANISYSQDGCVQDMTKLLYANIYTGQPSIGSSFLDQSYRYDSLFKRYYRELSVCGDFTLRTNVDGYYSFTNTPEPFVNEFRKPYIIDELKYVIPPFFNLANNQALYVEEFRNSFTAEITRDTSVIMANMIDSAGYTILIFSNIQDEINFKTINNLVLLDLKTSCYGFVEDTIWTTKKIRYHLQSSDPQDHKQTTLKQGFPFVVSGIKPNFGNKLIQPLKDSNKVWNIELSSLTNTYTPDQYFTYHNSWMSLLNKSTHIIIDSLIEQIDSVTFIKHQPNILPSNKYIYLLGKTWQKRFFKLYTKYDLCAADSVIVQTSTNCSGYPDFSSNEDNYCNSIIDEQKLVYNPEGARLDAQFIRQPDTILNQPCDTFLYEIKVSNNGLGHSFNNVFTLFKPEGLRLISARLQTDSQNVIQLPPPTLIKMDSAYYWNIDNYLGDDGLPGFYKVDNNFYKIELIFEGDCALEDGATISANAYARNICQMDIQTKRISADPMKFKTQPDQQETLYDLKLSFHSEESCEDDFLVKVVLTSLSNKTKADGQKINFLFRKELRLLADAIIPEHNITPEDIKVNRFAHWESLEVPLKSGINLGDSIVFSFPLEKTCLANCKTTDFKVQLNTPLDIACQTVQNNRCEQLKQVQSWSFDDVVMGPTIQLLDYDLKSTRLNDGNEFIEFNYRLTNLSQFSAAIQYVISYYYDADMDGKIGAADILVAKDTTDNAAIKGFETKWIFSNMEIPGIYSCKMIATIDLLDNPCLCISDTLILNPSIIEPQKAYYDMCHTDEIQIGFNQIKDYTYYWLDSNSVNNIDGSMANYLYTQQIADGQFAYDTLVILAEKQIGCSVFDSIFIRIYSIDLLIDQNKEILCHGDTSASIIATGVGPYNDHWKYQWEGLNDTTPILHNLGEGKYVLRISDINGCSDIDSIVITAPPPLTDSMEITSNYNGYDISCNEAKDGSININVLGGTPDYSYQWSSGKSTNNVLSNIGSGWFGITVTDQNGCIITDSIQLNQPPPITIMGQSEIAGCDDQHLGSIEIIAEGGVPEYLYDWGEHGKGSQLNDLKSGWYSAVITDKNGCQVDTMIFVDQTSDPIINVNITDSTIIFGDQIKLMASSNAVNPKYKWFPDSSFKCDTCASVVVTPNEDQEYWVEVTDENGCSARAEITILIKYNEKVYIPNAFTPNGDGINDGFTVFSSPSVERILWLKIYDRWGNFLFQTEDIALNDPTVGWDGTFNGKPMNPGVYVYVTEVLYHSGLQEIFSGDVTLVR